MAGSGGGLTPWVFGVNRTMRILLIIAVNESDNDGNIGAVLLVFADTNIYFIRQHKPSQKEIHKSSQKLVDSISAYRKNIFRVEGIKII